MAYKHMKKYRASLIISKTQIETTGVANAKKVDDTKCS